ncbi:hypothetical protein [Streptomyces sp. OK228]|uniref:hypothetical protein n=1 Tax=Streptomyces sp. OK228 TaxID=1882786 RepID=UPI000BCAB8CD|nr:hypothetical protein [Streptomyces sp. OK228]SOE25644.1 hypothetical protein SAMN05442782_2387 [Streptomyces sp. OK228]
MPGEYEEVPAIQGGKRCGVQWAPWMDDWFTSWSPRNSNNNAEGPWDHWVDLAIKILADPMTAIVRPEAHAVAVTLDQHDFYDETQRDLTEAELGARFPDNA